MQHFQFEVKTKWFLGILNFIRGFKTLSATLIKNPQKSLKDLKLWSWNEIGNRTFFTISRGRFKEVSALFKFKVKFVSSFSFFVPSVSCNYMWYVCPFIFSQKWFSGKLQQFKVNKLANTMIKDELKKTGSHFSVVTYRNS